MGQTTQETVKVDLASTADTAGFEKFTSAYNTLAAAKASHVKQNEIFVNSERKVRVNLVDLVTGLNDAQDATQATGVAIAHLTEVFELGFAGGVVGGIVAAVVGVAGKSTEALKNLGSEIDENIRKAEQLSEKFSGIELTPQQEGQKQIDDELRALDKMEAKVKDSAGWFSDALGTIGTTFGLKTDVYGTQQTDLGAIEGQRLALARAQSDLNNPAGREMKADREADKKRASENAADQQEVLRLRQELSDSDAKLGESKMTPKQRMNALQQRMEVLGSAAKNEGETPMEQKEKYEFLLKRNELQEEFNRLKSEEERAAMSAADAAAREAESAKTKAEEEKARQAAAAERAAERNEDTHQKEGRVRATIIAGSQRQAGGGGGAYSQIAIDPVAQEARKHTALLTSIDQTLKSTEAPNASMSAVLG